jgi:hypothetical protein
MLACACGLEEIAEGKPSEEKKAAAHDPAGVRAERKQPAYAVCVSSVCFQQKASRKLDEQSVGRTKAQRKHKTLHSHSRLLVINDRNQRQTGPNPSRGIGTQSNSSHQRERSTTGNIPDTNAKEKRRK